MAHSRPTAVKQPWLVCQLLVNLRAFRAMAANTVFIVHSLWQTAHVLDSPRQRMVYCCETVSAFKADKSGLK